MNIESYRNEDVSRAHQAGAFLWLLISNRYPSLKIGKTRSQLMKSVELYRSKLEALGSTGTCMSYDALTLNGFLKEKHWKYAAYMATLSSLPILHRVCEGNQITSAIIGKTSVGTSAKLLDNLNDEIHSLERAIESLRIQEKVMTQRNLVQEERESEDLRLTWAENSAFQIASWTAEAVMETVEENSRTFQLYVSDVKKLVRGQIDSLLHKAKNTVSLPKIGEYLTSITEKSIGDVWVDVDLCLLESALGHIDEELFQALQLFRVGNGFVFKSSLVYDDAQDLLYDLQTNSINSAVILGIERGVISENDLIDKPPTLIAQQLETAGTLMDTIRLADLLFLTGIKLIQTASLKESKIVDWNGLLMSYRFVRLFNLRKILRRNTDYETIRLFLSSLEKFEDLQREIPDHIQSLHQHLKSTDN